MKKMFLIALLCTVPIAASAEDNVIHLDGNAKVITDGNNGRYVFRGYDTDELIVRRMLGHDDHFYRRTQRVPNNEYSTLCGGANNARERRRCREDIQDLDEDRAEIYRRYND